MSGTIGKQIRKLRQDRALTQAQLASVVGVSVQAVSKWECGGTPDIDLLPVLADYFGVSIDQLFGYRTSQEAEIDVLIQQEMWRTPEAERTRRASELAWAAVKGLAGIANMVELGFTETEGDSEENCSRCRLLFNDGLAYASADQAAPSVFILPEPQSGYRKELQALESYEQLFSLLADRDNLRLLFFLYSRRAIPFSIEHVANTLQLTVERVCEGLAGMKDFGWIQEEEVELAGGSILLYRPVLNEAFVAFIYFASELIRRTRLWYFSNAKRERPIL